MNLNKLNYQKTEWVSIEKKIRPKKNYILWS